MSPINRNMVDEKLAKLRVVTSKLEDLRQTTEDEFLGEFRSSDATMHNLVIGIEVIVDIGNHLLLEMFQIKGDSYADVIIKLGEKKVIPAEFATEHAPMAKFRNLIIHEYGVIDLEKVYNYLQKSPDVFRSFAQYFEKFVNGAGDRS